MHARPAVAHRATSLVASLLVVATVLTPAPARAQTRSAASGSSLAGFDAYVERARRDWRVPGMAVVVVKDDSVVFMKGYGVRTLGRPEPVTVHTVFGNMSTTKAFTAMLLAMLADSGRVTLDAPVTTYIPGLQLSDPYVTRELTVRDLLTHRIGFPDPDYLWAGATHGIGEIERRLRWVPVVSSLRSRFAYNNVAYGIAGDVAGRAAGTTWQALLRARILDPLGMTETHVDGKALVASHAVDVTSPHAIIDDTVRVVPGSDEEVDPVAPAGSMYTTATDMAKWMRFLLAGGRIGSQRLVSAANFAQLFAPQQVVPADEFYPTASLTKPHFQAYGMGWFLEDYRGEFVAFHTGSIEGRSAIVGLIPDRHLAVAIFTNLDHSELRHALMYTAFDRYLGGGVGAGHDWSAEMRTMYRAAADSALGGRRAREQARVPNTRPTLTVDRYVGTYADSLFGEAAVTQDAKGLRFKLGSAAGTMDHWQYDVFRVRWDDPFQGTDYLAFTIDPDARVGGLRIVGGAQAFRRRSGP